MYYVDLSSDYAEVISHVEIITVMRFSRSVQWLGSVKSTQL